MPEAHCFSAASLLARYFYAPPLRALRCRPLLHRFALLTPGGNWRRSSRSPARCLAGIARWRSAASFGAKYQRKRRGCAICLSAVLLKLALYLADCLHSLLCLSEAWLVSVYNQRRRDYEIFSIGAAESGCEEKRLQRRTYMAIF